MENKYYTPELEEFCVGFEYESRFNHDDFKKQTYKLDSFLSVYGDGEYFFDNFQDLRVKHLDREDIESLGWGIKEELGFEFYELNGFSLHFYPNEEQNICIVMTKFKIKNKTELSKLMKQLNIKTQ